MSKMFLKKIQTVHFWLTKDRPEKELNEPRLLDALCTAVPRHSVCTANGDTRSCGMTDGKLCYTVNIVVHGKVVVSVLRCQYRIQKRQLGPITVNIL